MESGFLYFHPFRRSSLNYTQKAISYVQETAPHIRYKDQLVKFDWNNHYLVWEPVTDLPFYVFIPVVCWAPVDLDPREMVTPGSSNR
jgi:hypothetical protein